MKNSRILGAHVSAAGGLDKGLDRAVALHASSMQIFSASPRIWKKPSLATLQTQEYFSKKTALNFGPVFTHALYLVNLAADTPELLEKSLSSIIFELNFDAQIGGSGVVVHLGSHKGKGWEAVKDQVLSSIQKILEVTPDNSTLLIENSAGQKGKLCSDLSEIRWLVDQVKSPRLKICIDTCHAHAAGYWLGSLASQPENSRGLLVEELEKLELWSLIACLHVNDSRGEFNSGIDNHRNLGDGAIGKELFQEFLNHPLVPKNIPLILEVPGLDDNGPDLANMERLASLVGQELA